MAQQTRKRATKKPSKNAVQQTRGQRRATKKPVAQATPQEDPFTSESSLLHVRKLHQQFTHAHLYYVCAVLSTALFVFSLVQGIIFHTLNAGIPSAELSLSLAFTLYLLAVFFLAIAWRCLERGKRHYRY
ncbi:hypothetical protein D6783_03865 [Candidatus Woesearchaeota archaeon]|nr:MAG: hypothetical protein D6783_03865 [Candidatus Woesearchaeota archaeon]